MIAIVAVIVIAIALAIVAVKGSGSLDRDGGGDLADVVVVRIAIDARVRAAVVAALDAIGGGPGERVRELARALRGLRQEWRYGGAVDRPVRSAAEAHRTSERYLVDARLRARVADTDADLALLTIVIAARQALLTFARITRAEELRSALEALSSTHAIDVISVESVVTPTTTLSLVQAYGDELIAI